MNYRVLAVALLASAVLASQTAAERLKPPEGVERPSPLLQRLRQGVGQGNVLGGADLSRPLLGVVFHSGGGPGGVALRLAHWKGAADFVEVPAAAEDVAACERAGVPWLGTCPVTLPLEPAGMSQAWLDAGKTISLFSERFQDFPNLLGWCVAPSFAPGGSGTLAPSLVPAFAGWLRAQYADELPGVDTNADGLTLNRECAVSLAGWDALTPDVIAANPLLSQAATRWLSAARQASVLEAGRLFRVADSLRPVVAGQTADDPVEPVCGDARSVGSVPVRAWPDRPEAKALEGFGLQRTPGCVTTVFPRRTASCFVEWDLTVPPGASLHFGCRLSGKSADGVEASVRVFSGLTPETPWQQTLVPGADALQATVDISTYAGKKVRLRLEATPGARKEAAGDSIEWLDPLLQTEDMQASLLEMVNWWQARAGCRISLPGGPSRDVVTGSCASVADPAALEATLGMASGGPRILLNGVHPTGSTDTLSPQQFGQFWGRALAFKPAAVVLAGADASSAGASTDLEPAVAEIARWRNFFQLVTPYAGITRKRPLGVFLPEGRPDLVRQAALLDPLGVAVQPLSQLDHAADFRAVIVVLGDLDAVSEEKALAFLQAGLKGRRALVFVPAPVQGPLGRKRSKDARAALREALPVYPMGAEMEPTDVAAAPGETYPFSCSREVSWAQTRGWEPVAAAKGRTVGAQDGGAMVLCGLPSAGIGDGPSALQRLAESWLRLKPLDVLDSGLVKVVRSAAIAHTAGLWSVEPGGDLQIPADLAAYDLAARHPVEQSAGGGSFVYAFRRDAGARLVDPGVCLPLSVTLEGGQSVIRVECPPGLTDADVYRMVFWSSHGPSPLESGGAWSVEDLGDGFYSAVCSRPGVYTLRLSGAVKPRPPMEWNPMDH